MPVTYDSIKTELLDIDTEAYELSELVDRLLKNKGLSESRTQELRRILCDPD